MVYRHLYIISRFLERCCNFVNNFTDLFQRGPRDKKASYLRVTVQRPADLIYIPSLRPHAVLTIDIGKPTHLPGWDASTTADFSILIRRMEEYNIGLRSGTWWKVELGNRVISPTVGPQASEEQLQQHWLYWEKHCPHLLANLIV